MRPYSEGLRSVNATTVEGMSYEKDHIDSDRHSDLHGLSNGL